MTEREVVLAEEKPWWKSKTMLFNMAAAALIALEMNLPSLQGMIDPPTYAYMLMGVNVVNVVLRFVTKAPVTMR